MKPGVMDGISFTVEGVNIAARILLAVAHNDRSLIETPELNLISSADVNNFQSSVTQWDGIAANFVNSHTFQPTNIYTDPRIADIDPRAPPSVYMTGLEVRFHILQLFA
jgi:hypothetical protein